MITFTGNVFERVETLLGLLSVTEGENYLWVAITVSGKEVIKFPLDKDSDSNEIALRTENIINQCGLVANSVRVVVEPVE